MIEALVLIVAVCVLAIAMRPLIEWVQMLELQRGWDRAMADERRQRAEFYAAFSASRPSAHAIITGITS